jgi:hypothetical protein
MQKEMEINQIGKNGEVAIERAAQETMTLDRGSNGNRCPG